MRKGGLSRSSALLLVLMVLWCAPVKWLHSCGGGGHHVHNEGRSVSVKEHCSICDLAIPLATTNDPVEVKEPAIHVVVLGAPGLRFAPVSSWPERQGRAPPVA